MVRIAAFFVISFMPVLAQATAGSKIDYLVKTITQSSDLREVHASLNELYNTSTSPTAPREIRERAALELKDLSANARARALTNMSGVRIAEDLLTVHVGELGSSNKSNVAHIDAMITFGSERMKIAAAIFLREHFLGRNPEESFFPLRPSASERPQVNWESGMCLWAIDRMPRMLARLIWEAAHNPGTDLAVAAQTTYKRVVGILFEAANDIHDEPGATAEAMNVRRIRQRLATKYLDDLAKIAEEHRKVRFPSPGLDPDTKFIDGSTIVERFGPARRLSDDPHIEGPVRNCEGQMVIPLNSIKSTAIH